MKYYQTILIGAFTLLLMGCQEQRDPSKPAQIKNKETFFASTWETMRGEILSLAELKQNTASVFIILSPDCPICQRYPGALEEMRQEFASQGVKLYGVFPGRHFGTESGKAFQKEYGIQFPVLIDKELKLVKMLSAEVTPEAFLLDPGGKVMYSGRIDNWFVSWGKQRGVVTKHDLKNAINTALRTDSIPIPRTEPIGCFIFAVKE